LINQGDIQAQPPSQFHQDVFQISRKRSRAMQNGGTNGVAMWSASFAT
jgi:hypothetical protein